MQLVNLIAEEQLHQDFVAYWSGGQSVAAGRSPYAWLSEERPLSSDDYVYPPLLAVLLAPFTRVTSYTTARWGWLIFSALSLLLGGWLIWRSSGLRLWGRPLLALVPLLALWPSVIWTLSIGQVTMQLLLVLAAAEAAVVSQRQGVAGALVSVGSHLKTFPLLLVGYLALRRQWRACLSAVVTGLVLLALLLLAVGWEAHWVYLTQVVRAQQVLFVSGWNASLTGFWMHLLSGTAALGAIAVSSLVMVAVSAFAIWRAPPGRSGENTAFGLAVLTSMLLAPINSQYNLVLLILPLAIAAARVQSLWPRYLRWLMIIALCLSFRWELCDMPGLQNVCYDLFFSDGGSPPVAGVLALLLSGPVFGQVVLWALLVRLCFEAGASEPAAAKVTPAHRPAGRSGDGRPIDGLAGGGKTHGRR
ncbi:MAG TPA: glycosyltransferase family 87 protein [Chloroflexota bacterium]